MSQQRAEAKVYLRHVKLQSNNGQAKAEGRFNNINTSCLLEYVIYDLPYIFEN